MASKFLLVLGLLISAGTVACGAANLTETNVQQMVDERVATAIASVPTVAPSPLVSTAAPDPTIAPNPESPTAIPTPITAATVISIPTATPSPSTQFQNGFYRVGIDILPGTYTSDSTAICSWSLFADFRGQSNDKIANNVKGGNQIVKISESDTGFESTDCGEWVRAPSPAVIVNDDGSISRSAGELTCFLFGHMRTKYAQKSTTDEDYIPGFVNSVAVMGFAADDAREVQIRTAVRGLAIAIDLDFWGNGVPAAIETLSDVCISLFPVQYADGLFAPIPTPLPIPIAISTPRPTPIPVPIPTPFPTATSSAIPDPGFLSAPKGIAIGIDGSVYLVDSNNNRIQRFTFGGTFLGAWGSKGNGEGQFNTPTGIAIDNAGVISVTDTGNNRVQQFRAGGKYIAEWGMEGNNPDQ